MNQVAVKNKDGEYTHISVPDEVFLYIQQLENAVYYPTQTGIRKAYPERFPPEHTSEQYINDVLVTAAGDHEAIAKRLSDHTTVDMMHAAMGMVTEAAELMDMLKKHIFYGKELDLVNAEEELGDSNWYQSLMIHSIRMKEHVTSWEQIWEKNIAKLKARYGDKFTEAAAKNRDLDTERKVLKGDEEAR